MRAIVYNLCAIVAFVLYQSDNGVWYLSYFSLQCSTRRRRVPTLEGYGYLFGICLVIPHSQRQNLPIFQQRTREGGPLQFAGCAGCGLVVPFGTLCRFFFLLFAAQRIFPTLSGSLDPPKIHPPTNLMDPWIMDRLTVAPDGGSVIEPGLDLIHLVNTNKLYF